MAWTDPAAAADAAWATSDTLHVAAGVLGSRLLRRAADAYDRAARSPYGRIPPPSPAGNRLRQAARLLSAFACLVGDRSTAPIVLITRLAALAEAVAELRESQQHAAQAAAARAAAERLYAAARPAPPAQPRPAQRASTAAQLAGQSFPRQLHDQQQDSPVRPRADRHHCDGRHHPSYVALPADAAGTAQHQICGFQRPNATGRPRRHLAAPGEHQLPHALPLWRLRHVHAAAGTRRDGRQLAYGHLRLMSPTVTAGQEMVPEIRLI